MPEQRQPRIEDPAYLAWIREQPCCLCGGPAEAAHLRVGSINDGKPITGMQEKSSDRWALPLCRRHHELQHAAGDELVFWASYGINPFLLAISYQREREEEP